MPDALPAVTVLAERSAQLAQTFERRLGLDVVVGVDDELLLALRDRQRRNLGRELAGLDGGGAELVAAQCIFILFLARDADLLGDVLGGLRHEELAERVIECSEQQVFDLLLLAEAEAFARAADHVRHLAHVLHAAREAQLRLAEQHRVRGRDDRLDARTAQAVDGQRRLVDRDAGLEGHVARAVDRVAAALGRIADEGLVDLLGLHTCALEGRLGRVRAEIDRRYILELAETGRSRVLGHGGTGTADNHQFCLHRRSIGHGDRRRKVCRVQPGESSSGSGARPP